MNRTQFPRRYLLASGAASLGALALNQVAQAKTKKAPATPKAAPAPLTAATSDATPSASMMKASASDIALLSAALGVEQVQAAFYSQVLGAHQKHAYLSERALAAVTLMASHEAAHVQTISDTLTSFGADVPAAPTFAFPYTAFISPIGMAWLGYSLEEIAIGSHLSALEKLDSRSLRGAVATILGADSAQAALLRTLSGFEFSPRFFEAKLSVAQVEMLLAPYRS